MQASATLSRRAMFAATPALALAATTAAAQPAEHTELERIGQDWLELERQIEAKHNELSALLPIAYPPPPPELHWQKGDWFGSVRGDDVGKPMTAADVDRHRTGLKTHWLCSDAERDRIHARAREIISAEQRYWEIKAEARRTSGADRLQDEICDLQDRQTAIEQRSKELAATTRGGLAFKARLLARYADFEPGDYADQLLKSLLADLREAA